MVESPARPRVEGRLDLDALTRFLAAHVELGPGQVSARLLTGGRSNPTYELAHGEQRWILRRPPFGNVLPSTHDVAREHRVIAALAGTAVPVPAVTCLCEDDSVLGAPFYVMAKLEGRTLRDGQDTAGLDVETRSRLSRVMIDTLHDLHEIDPDEVGLSGWGRSDGYLDRQVHRWTRQWRSVHTAPLPALEDLLVRLARCVPETRFPGIVHGDFKIDNLMVDHDDPAQVVGVLDWEMSTLGDTLADLGLLVSFWDEEGGVHNPITDGATAHPGFMTAAEVVEAYAARRGVGIDDLDWYLVFADVKIAVILEQIHARHLAGHSVGAGVGDVGAMVGPLVERACARAAASTDPRLRRAAA
jgi:aminoglycoside phosphotransferase (APT) family kinase protein